jgi:hypothetical protein
VRRSDDLAGTAIAVRSILAVGDDLPDRDPDVTVVLADVRLWRLAPTAVEQDAGRRDTRGRWELFLAHDRREDTNSLRRV